MNKLLVLMVFVSILVIGCSPTTEPPKTTIPLEPSVARIESISPVKVNTGEAVTFSGSGESPIGTIIAYKWRSSLDSDLSDKASFSTESLTEGRHKIFFSVENDGGLWSQEVTGEIVVSAPVPIPVINYFRVSPLQIGLTENATLSWHVTGATIVSIDQEIGTVNSDSKTSISPDISTEYTLTASNGAGSAKTGVDLIVVPVGDFNTPVINGFAGNPGSISRGESSTLEWNTSNTAYVRIDPNVGFGSPIGNARVSPKKTTAYTITAFGSAGFVIGTTQIVVEKETGAGKPDLVVSDIYQVASSNGLKIGYTIENRGTQTAPVSISRLYADGLHMDMDTVGIITPGAKLERQFDGWNYNPSTNIIEVSIDADNNVLESNKGNNILEIVLPVSELFDFIAGAPQAVWSNGYQTVNFAGDFEDINGSAAFVTDKRLEDATGPAKYLETRPKSTLGGFITGDYHIGHLAKTGDHFYAIVGLLEGANEGNVEFQVYIRIQDQQDWVLLGNGMTATYDYMIKSMSLPVPPEYFGKKVDFRLRVNNKSDPLQNWAVWVEAKLIR